MGGAIGGLLGGGGGDTTTTSTQTTTLPGWLKGPTKDLVSRTTDLLDNPYVAYGGERTAGFTEDELRAQQMMRNLTGQADPFMQQAQGIAGQVAQRGLDGFTSEQLQPFMNPYVENVLDVAKRRRIEEFDRAKNDLASRNASIGAFGGSRAAIGEQNLYDNFARNMADYEMTGLADAYQSGLGSAMQGTQMAGNAASALSNITGQRQQAGIQGIGALATSGADQRGLLQRDLDIGYEDFLTEQRYPYEQLQFASGMINPIANMMKGSTTVQEQETEEGDSGFLGKALGIASIAAAPFTGGASLMGGLGGMGATMSGLGSLGSAVGLGGLGSAIGGMGLDAINGIGSMFGAPEMMNFAGGSGALPMPGIKPPKLNEGGRVRGYNDGGYVSPRGSLGTFTNEETEELIRQMHKPELNTVREKVFRTPFTHSPQDSRLKRGLKATGNVVDYTGTLIPRGIVAAGDTASDFAGWLLEPSGPSRDDLIEAQRAAAKDVPTPERKPQEMIDMWRSMAAERNSKGGLDGTITKENLRQEPEPEKRGGINMPLLQFGAKLLSANDDFFGALGQATEAYATTKQDEEDRMRLIARQKAQDEIDQMRAEAYQRQVALTEQMAPYKLAKAEADVLKSLSSSDKETQKRVDNYFKIIKEGNPTIPDEEALQRATALAGGTMAGTGLGHINAEDFYKVD